MSRPFVSVLIDTYNHEKFIERAITSALEQDLSPSDYEIVVVDDGSTDGTPEIVKKFAPRVVHLRKPNGGQASAFNYGIPRCRGAIVAFLDGDDWWMPKKLSTIAYEFASQPEIGAVGHGLYEVDEAGAPRYLNVPDRCYTARLATAEDVRLLPELRSFLGTSRFACRRTVLDKILPVPEALVIEADEFLATLAVALSGALVLDLPLTNYRLHSDNLFQFSSSDPARVARKQKVFACLAHEYPRRLADVGVTKDLSEPLRQAAWLESQRLSLALGQGWPWDTFRAERVALRQSHISTSAGYRFFHMAVLTSALLLPPRLFYRGREWYAKRGFAGIRRRIAPATPTPSLVVRKAIHP